MLGKGQPVFFENSGMGAFEIFRRSYNGHHDLFIKGRVVLIILFPHRSIYFGEKSWPFPLHLLEKSQSIDTEKNDWPSVAVYISKSSTGYPLPSVPMDPIYHRMARMSSSGVLIGMILNFSTRKSRDFWNTRQKILILYPADGRTILISNCFPGMPYGLWVL